MIPTYFTKSDCLHIWAEAVGSEQPQELPPTENTLFGYCYLSGQPVLEGELRAT